MAACLYSVLPLSYQAAIDSTCTNERYCVPVKLCGARLARVLLLAVPPRTNAEGAEEEHAWGIGHTVTEPHGLTLALHVSRGDFISMWTVRWTPIKSFASSARHGACKLTTEGSSCGGSSMALTSTLFIREPSPKKTRR